MAFISKEVPTGAIDGANTAYTLANNINTIDDIFIDGAIYFGTITITGDKTFTVGNAPTVSIVVDYYDAAPVDPAVPTGAIQLQDAYNSLLRLKKDLSDVSNATFIEWCNFANKIAYRHLIGIDSGRFVTTNTYSSVTSGGQTLPTDFHDIQASGTGIYLTDDSGDPTTSRLPMTGYGSTSLGFYIQGGNVVFTGVNNAETFIMRYIPSLDQFDDLTDYFTISTMSDGVETIPYEYLQELVNDLDRLYSQWDEVAGEESLADFRFARLLDEMNRTIRKEADAYSVPDLSIAF